MCYFALAPQMYHLLTHHQPNSEYPANIGRLSILLEKDPRLHEFMSLPDRIPRVCEGCTIHPFGL